MSFTDFLGALINEVLFPGDYANIRIPAQPVFCANAHPEFQRLYFSEARGTEMFRQREYGESSGIHDLNSPEFDVVRELLQAAVHGFMFDAYPLFLTKLFPAETLSSIAGVRAAAKRLMEDRYEFDKHSSRILMGLLSYWRTGARTFVMACEDPDRATHAPGVVATATIVPPISIAELLQGNAVPFLLATEWWDDGGGKTVDELVKQHRDEFLSIVKANHTIDRSRYKLVLVAVEPMLPTGANGVGQGIGKVFLSRMLETLRDKLGGEGLWAEACGHERDRLGFYLDIVPTSGEKFRATHEPTMRAGLFHDKIVWRFTS